LVSSPNLIAIVDAWDGASATKHEFRLTLTLELMFERIHPEDRRLVRDLISTAARERKDCHFEQRLLMPDDSVKFVHIVAHALDNSSGDLEYLGAVTSVTQSVRADQECEMLRQAHAELARVSRVTTMGELTRWHPN
jgi:hypothetical protein